MEINILINCSNCDHEIPYKIYNLSGRPEIHITSVECISVQCPKCDANTHTGELETFSDDEI